MFRNSQPMLDEFMVQQQLPAKDSRQRRWQHMVAVIMLNQTNRRSVKRVLPEFLDYWPTLERFLAALEHDPSRRRIQDVIRPLGMVNVRYQRLAGMSRDFLYWDGDRADALYGIGRYGSDSYEIFFRHNYSVKPTDKELQRYLAEETCA